MNKKTIDFVIMTIGLFGNTMFYVQAFKIFELKSADSVSLNAFLISLLALSSWTYYGFYLKNTPLVVANLFGIFGTILVLSGIYIYS
ncbi:SemiSWEET family transporter [Pigmentibacter sp. JX0631]|uniref:SemiSWEET family transporter n=1 Tax=Pigmentibacter sp. JX0631 TaxID=2976982 RepID=UPI00246883B8|nr:SemiSWEET family transporter [Pigmentibacter sp. JX0631]WGL59764.1 SemiSWEET family transporter [Pigmentibacter sp. JX0631]